MVTGIDKEIKPLRCEQFNVSEQINNDMKKQAGASNCSNFFLPNACVEFWITDTSLYLTTTLSKKSAQQDFLSHPL